ncbi:sialoadhesin-like isoform X4 [Misgurnus anguillicaudatus]|uniref:sialoadhesin-like isoform X4 n=1 Tax=Misgurnus anguillicaudatus TaxID=75329 RepID=UPI003CCF40F2
MMNSRLSSLILLLHIQGYLTLDRFTVSCDKQNVCAVRGAWVKLRCSYSNINIKTGFWFSQKQKTNWRNKDEPEDLTLDSDYSGRVDQWINEDFSRLTIDDLRERDSGDYQLMIIMKDGVKHLGSVTVNLTVTVQQVKMNPESTDKVKLICDSSCNLISENNYYWYKNGQYLKDEKSKSIFVSFSGNSDSYYCSTDAHPSSSVCLSNSVCWGVTYTSTRVCALVGSTVDIHSSYSHPTGDTVDETVWYYLNFDSKFKDLREDHQFAGRVEFVGNTLRIKDVNMSDSGQYAFRIITNTSEEFSGYPGVFLTVTDTQVISSPKHVIDGEKVILSCSTKCTLDSKHTYIWYKNGQQVTDGLRLLNKLYLDSINSEELQEYSCTVRDSVSSTDPNKSTWLNTAIILSVFLTLALIGVLIGWYRMRSCILSRNNKDAKEEAQYDSVHIDAAPSEQTQKEDCKNEDIHYSSVNFVNSKTKQTSSDTTNTTENEDIQYATVMFS